MLWCTYLPIYPFYINKLELFVDNPCDDVTCLEKICISYTKIFSSSLNLPRLIINFKLLVIPVVSI